MRNIADKMEAGNPYKAVFSAKARELFDKALPLLFQSNYGGDHWLATFAVYAD